MYQGKYKKWLLVSTETTFYLFLLNRCKEKIKPLPTV